MNLKHFLSALLVVTIPFVAAISDEPRIVRENTEWLDVWVPNANAKDLPRMLLIGDSITRGYFKEVEEKLKGKAYVARLATSKSVGDPGLLAEVALVLGQTHFDVVHFNNGMHGWGYSEDEYRRSFPLFLETIKKGAKGAKLIWASTTPVRESGNLAEFNAKTERVRERNRIAAEVVAREKILVNDLFSLVAGQPEFHSNDGVHFNGKGITAQAEQVARSILGVLK